MVYNLKKHELLRNKVYFSLQQIGSYDLLKEEWNETINERNKFIEGYND